MVSSRNKQYSEYTLKATHGGVVSLLKAVKARARHIDAAEAMDSHAWSTAAQFQDQSLALPLMYDGRRLSIAGPRPHGVALNISQVTVTIALDA